MYFLILILISRTTVKHVTTTTAAVSLYCNSNWTNETKVLFSHQQLQLTHIKNGIIHLANILLKQAQSQSLMQSNFASVPDLLQLPVMCKHLKFNSSNSSVIIILLNLTFPVIKVNKYTTFPTMISYRRFQCLHCCKYSSLHHILI